ncbi:hypothetical protein PX52LOC_06913 [Limnoglobus roseus]|uniref:Uncharacterized protein n=1 Tax=Limnoglobus roseus TaxID=2598579 RepID=A0A5C1APZ8_9BACT|nr:hypothetical protein PX52LOC_06913 [Limnoglobus roseus]
MAAHYCDWCGSDDHVAHAAFPGNAFRNGFSASLCEKCRWEAERPARNNGLRTIGAIAFILLLVLVSTAITQYRTYLK